MSNVFGKLQKFVVLFVGDKVYRSVTFASLVIWVA